MPDDASNTPDIRALDPGLVDLAPELPYRVRLRVLEIPPRAVVPLHGHAQNPTIAYYRGGVLTELDPDGQPLSRRGGSPGMLVPDPRTVTCHGYRNDSDAEVLVVIADVVPASP